MATKVIKVCDMDKYTAARLFEMLNPGKVMVKRKLKGVGTVIITDTEPKDLTYPEGWYYAKGRFTNKHHSTTGLYSEVEMYTSEDKSWEYLATYCTLNT